MQGKISIKNYSAQHYEKYLTEATLSDGSQDTGRKLFFENYSV